MVKGQKRGEEKIAIVALLVFVLAIWIFGGGGGEGGREITFSLENPTRLINIVV